MRSDFWHSCFLALGMALLAGALLGVFLVWWWDLF